MSKIDLVAYEAQLRAMYAETEAVAKSHSEEKDYDPHLIAAQQAFAETNIQFALACAKLHNDGVPSTQVASAIGFLLGGFEGDILASMLKAGAFGDTLVLVNARRDALHDVLGEHMGGLNKSDDPIKGTAGDYVASKGFSAPRVDDDKGGIDV